MILQIDSVRLNFSEEGLLLLNICLGFIMFGVALQLRPAHFREVVLRPRSLLTGIAAQFLLLPFITFLLTLLWQPQPSLALGMILVAACPGGNISNFMSLLAKGNVALSVGLTAFATVAALLLTPLNFALYGYLNPHTAPLLQAIHLNPLDMLQTVMLLLGVPLVLGMAMSRFFPAITARITQPVKWLSMLFFVAFVVVAFLQNSDYFQQYIYLVFLLVLVHNALAYFTGYLAGVAMQVPEADRRTITIETGIQNSGLGLVLIFNFFDGMGGMAFVAAWWGIWHILSGLSLAAWWSYRGVRQKALS